MTNEDKIWWYATGGKESGPYTAQELKSLAQSGKIGPSDLIWREGLEKWLLASSIKGLLDTGSSSAAASTPPPVPPQQSVQPAQPAMEYGRDRREEMFTRDPHPYESASSGDISDEEAMKIFVGKKYDHYASKWARFTEKKLAWSWAGFFLSIGWMIYRKMYRYAALLFAAMVGVGFLEGFLDVSQNVNRATNFAFGILIGLQGNYWYKLHAEGKIKRIRESIIPSQIRDELARQGGTNLAGALIFFAIMFLIALALVGAVARLRQ